MKFKELIDEVERINLVSGIFGIGETINYKVIVTDTLHKHGTSFRAHLPSVKDKTSNGIYCFLDEKEKLLYIGKASSNNISQEMFGKIPLPVVVDKQNDIATFEKNYWEGKDMPEYAKECISSGHFYIGFLIIKSSEITSKLEKYLQTIYANQNNGKLPPLNSRIG